MAKGILNIRNQINCSSDIIYNAKNRGKTFNITNKTAVTVQYNNDNVRITSAGLADANAIVCVKSFVDLTPYNKMTLTIGSPNCQTQQGYEPRFGVMKDDTDIGRYGQPYYNSFISSVMLRNGQTVCTLDIQAQTGIRAIGIYGLINCYLYSIKFS